MYLSYSVTFAVRAVSLALLLLLCTAPALTAQNRDPKPGQTLSGKEQELATPEAKEKKRLTHLYMRAIRRHANAGDRDSVLFYLDAQRTLQAQPPPDTLQTIMSYQWSAMNLTNAEFYPEAMASLDELQALYFDHPPFDTLGPLYASAQLIRGANYDERGLTDTALLYYREALREFGEIDNPFRFETYRAIAGVYDRQQLYDSAIYYLQQEILYGQRNGANRYIFKGSVEMAKVLQKTGQYEAALRQVEQAEAARSGVLLPWTMIAGAMKTRCELLHELGRDSVGYYCQKAYQNGLAHDAPMAAAGAATRLAAYHRGLGNADSVGYYVARAWEVSEKTPVDPDYASRAAGYATHLLGQGNRERAYAVMARALERHRELPELNDSGLGDLYTALARTEYATGRLDSAEVHYGRGMALLEDRYRRRSESNVADATARFEVAESSFALEREQADRAVAEARSAQQRTVLLSVLGAVGLLFLGGLWAYRRLSRDRRRIATANSQLAVAVKERETLLKEIHHRVKNNLQIISALLYKQAQNSVSEDVRNSLRDGQDRIQSMALVHQSLYQRDELVQINARNFVAELVTHLQRSQGSQVAVELQAADEELNMDRAIPVGLILNELVTNAFKYAFRGADSDRLNVVFKRTADGNEYELRVSDNGRGLPDGFDWRKTRSLGMNLINGLTRQLDGRWTLVARPGGGTVATINFAVAA